MRSIVTAMVFVFALAVGSEALAQSKCDASITKAAGKKVACKTGVHAKAQKKGTAPDQAKLDKCSAKFDQACQKAKSKGGCSAQPQTCAAIESEADDCVDALIGSPNGAFLD
jgi:hypothetical protein